MKNRYYYAGVKPNHRVDIFRSSNPNPTQESHGQFYLYCFGRYSTIRQAVQAAMYQNLGIDTPQGKSILR